MNLANSVQSSPQRLLSLDVLRGVALLGILLMNIQSFSMIIAAYQNPAAYGDLTGLNYWANWFTSVFAAEKFMTIFASLFGASMLLLMQKQTDSGTAHHWYLRRLIWLGVFGLFHVILLWFGDILLLYAMVGAVIYFAREWQSNRLFAVAVVFLLLPSLLYPLIGMSADFITAQEMQQQLSLWQPSDAEIAQEIATVQGSWLQLLSLRLELYNMVFVAYMFYFLRICGLMMCGMALYKLGVLQGEKSVGFYRLHCVIALVLGVAVANYSYTIFADSNYQMMLGQSTVALLNYWASIVLAWGYVCGVLWLLKGTAASWLQRFIAPVGQMALTNYLMQSVICCSLFYGWGFGWFGAVQRFEQLGIVLLVWLFQGGVSYYWLRHYRSGPMEWLLSSLIRWQKQPLRKAVAGRSL